MKTVWHAIFREKLLVLTYMANVTKFSAWKMPPILWVSYDRKTWIWHTHKVEKVFVFTFWFMEKKIWKNGKNHRAEKLLAIKIFISKFLVFFSNFVIYSMATNFCQSVAKLYATFIHFFLYMSLSDKLFCQLRQFGLVLICIVFGSSYTYLYV